MDRLETGTSTGITPVKKQKKTAPGPLYGIFIRKSENFEVRL
jgi:hypothetical protein